MRKRFSLYGYIALLVALIAFIFCLIPYLAAQQRTVDNFELIRDQSSYYKVYYDTTFYSQHSTLHKAIQSSWELAKIAGGSPITIRRDIVIKVNYDTQPYISEGNRIISEINWTLHQDTTDTYALIIEAHTSAPKVRFLYQYDGVDTIHWKEPESTIITDTLYHDYQGTIQGQVTGYIEDSAYTGYFTIDTELLIGLN